jgi:protocatechuate 3,4-dioxygenase beta subunit
MRLLLVPLLAAGYEEPDTLSPSYRPGAPVREVVGQRATVLTGADGGYRFQSDPPEHIHMLVSAEGFEPLASNRYHPEGRPAGRFDILLTPSPS